MEYNNKEGSAVVATTLYRDYLIIVSSDLVETRGKWSIWVGVYWSYNDEGQSKVLNSVTDTFESKQEAEKFGLQMAKEWIDHGKLSAQSSGIR